ncbi:MAG: cysteine desulfurase [Bacteroidaceae bacterium]|nr:cysteine desulfurase [Bacteroidaceae bacterium]
MFDSRKIRADFPILEEKIYNHPLVYLDNAATVQRPKCVIDTISDMYAHCNSNVHRGIHYLSQQATQKMEDARLSVKDFINAKSSNEIIFTKGTTESINLVASSFTDAFMQAGDEVIISTMEHHSNIVPWQLQAAKKGVVVKVIPMSDSGELLLEEYQKLFSDKAKLLSVMQVSNVLGTVNPIKEMIKIAHQHGVAVLVDGAQAVAHMPVDVQDLDADFYAFSGHKMYGPTGVGILYGKEKWLEQMPPYQVGGEMIHTVSFEQTVFNELPYKFEAGTPDFVGNAALKSAIDYIDSIGFEAIQKQESLLLQYALEQLAHVDGMRFFGAAKQQDAVISFAVKDIHHFDMGTLLDRLGIAVRTGHHCAEPLMHRLGVEGTVRASFAIYNTKEEIDSLVQGIQRVAKMF